MPRKSKNKKKNEDGIGQIAHVQVHMDIFFLLSSLINFFLSVFSPIWGENFLVSLGRKHLGPIIYFPSSPSN